MPRTALIVTDMLNAYAVAHIHAHLADAALELMELNMDAEVCPAAECRL